jgi:hypothetical protein
MPSGRVRWVGVVAFVFIGLFLTIRSASAQSSITGVVRDESGGVLPGVTVEATSPVLIEKVRSVITDEQGRYRIVDLRPGAYKLTFTLTGFATTVREGVDLPASFVMTLNADLKVATLSETVTVTGATPLVDVQQASKTQVISREIIDSLPTTRNIMSLGILVPGVKFQTPDVGGSRAMEQPFLRVHGVNYFEQNQMVDGMWIQSNEDILSLSYFDDGMQSEASMSTSALPAENPGGGARINSILKDGGNQFSGAAFLGGSAGTWQAKNVDDYLKSRNIRSANGIDRIQNFNVSAGGPIQQNKLWYYGSVRVMSTNETVANVPKEFTAVDGEKIQGILDQHVNDVAARLTYQATQNNKLAVFFERIYKYKGKDFGYGTDPRGSGQRDPKHGHYAIGTAKYTSMLSTRWLLEGGYSTSYQHYTSFTQPARDFTSQRYTPNWYKYAQKTDTALNINPDCAFVTGCTSWMSSNNGRTEATRRVYQASLSYVTGTHNLKMGFQDSTGPGDSYSDRNGDLTANYVNNKPSTVDVYNTPTISKASVKYDLGVYAQDAWTLKRLTVNPGLRVQWFNSQINAVNVAAGRFAPARSFPEQKDMPKWGPMWAPRLSAVYDLFGDGKTALKASLSKYYFQNTNGWARRYANTVTTSDRRNWSDCAYLSGTSTCDPAQAGIPTNGDGIVQDNEIGPSSSTTFGLRADRNPEPGLPDTHHWEWTGGVQHELLSGVSLSVMFFHRNISDINWQDRTNIALTDYTAFQAAMPDISMDPTLSGVLNPSETITVYNLNPAKRSVYSSGLVDRKSVNDRSIYNALEIAANARLPRGITVFGGWTTERNVSKYCDATKNNPNGINQTDLYLGESVAAGGRFCDEGAFDVPLRHEIKLSGNTPLVYGITFGTILQSYPGNQRHITWQPGAGLYPGGQRTNAETILMSKPGSVYLPRWSQWDINLKKNFNFGKKSLSVQVDVFNVLNSNAIFATTDSIGPTLGNVTSIQQGRLPRLAFQMRW